MTSADVDAATEVILRADWGDRRTWFEFATSQPECQPVLATVDGEVVGTGVGTANGSVGWVGTIWVAPDRRGAGLGRALTQAVIDRLESAGCESLLLVATVEGRRLYRRMGFELQTRYQILEAPGLSAGEAGIHASVSVRPFEANDLGAMAALDAAATGEDRAHLLRRFANPSSTKVALDAAGGIRGFVVRAAWGGGATIADSDDVAMAILTARRLTSGPTGRVRVGLVADNVHGLAALERAGLHPVWTAPRMIRGAALTWRPDWIWGQFNHALG
ncbi:MAG TPA: GNAT family N-acetyltransferase [Candidatus Eisenbacteria bacterium]|nr:GNAT family N-acetyltransferase [Candidatus Eisenbacteria bacterium]